MGEGVYVISADRNGAIPWVVVDGTLHLLAGEIALSDLAKGKEEIRIEPYVPEEGNLLRSAIEQHPWLKQTIPARDDRADVYYSVIWSDFLLSSEPPEVPVMEVANPD